jgi:hypothetical protein
MRNILIILFFNFTFLTCFGQDDSLKKKSDDNFWAARFSLGIQDSPFIEAGVSRLFYGQKLDISAWCLYSALEMNYRNSSTEPKIYYGIKFGFENSWNLGMWALEAKYLTDNKKSVFVFTPKGGISLFGLVNLLYGYNFFSLNPDGTPYFPGLGHNQISLIININRSILKTFKN